MEREPTRLADDPEAAEELLALIAALEAAPHPDPRLRDQVLEGLLRTSRWDIPLRVLVGAATVAAAALAGALLLSDGLLKDDVGDDAAVRGSITREVVGSVEAPAGAQESLERPRSEADSARPHVNEGEETLLRGGSDGEGVRRAPLGRPGQTTDHRSGTDGSEAPASEFAPRCGLAPATSPPRPPRLPRGSPEALRALRLAERRASETRLPPPSSQRDLHRWVLVAVDPWVRRRQGLLVSIETQATALQGERGDVAAHAAAIAGRAMEDFLAEFRSPPLPTSSGEPSYICEMYRLQLTEAGAALRQRALHAYEQCLAWSDEVAEATEREKLRSFCATRVRALSATR